MPSLDAGPGASNGENPVGVRLGNKVRLPAASIAKASGAFATPEIAAANQELENRFYQNILHRALEGRAKPSSAKKDKGHQEEIPLDENGERTVMIEPGQQTERVLQESDEAFRSLFGNDAYNQRKMESSMEAASAGINE